jgi:peptidyl-prolyl cis-trans isomerase-like 3
MGDIKIEVYCDMVPIAAYNFLALCASNYYDNTVFHRNIKGFMIQGGDPTGTGKGGQSIYGKHFQDELVDELTHDTRGVVSMANKGPNTNGSQFFIAYNKAAHLNKKYTVFGRVISGFDTLDKVENVPSNERDVPLHPIRINSVTVHANPLAE